jgi:predicted nucleic acid-binding protein
LGLNRLGTFLRRHHKIALDTNIFIYELDANPRYLAFARHVFQWLAELHHFAVTSTLTMTEVQTRPYAAGTKRQANEYYALLSNYPHLEWIAPDLVIADLAAQFRAKHRMRTPDAIQAATAVRSSATGFISNDPIFHRVEGFEALTLDDLL